MNIDGDILSQLLEEDKNDDGWILELETALLSDCDINVIRKISNHKIIPNSLRYEFWQVCLGIKGRVKVLEDVFDLPEQENIRKDCQKLVNKLDNSESEKLSVLSDLESIITNFSRLNNCSYDSNNGWLELLETLLHLNIKRDELFKVFESIELRYIIKYYNSSIPNISNLDTNVSNSSYMQQFHLLRLILLYHDPELCNFFDTLKLTPETYSATWFRSLFCSLCNYNVSLTLLDTYLAYGNPFLIFFISLVMIINIRDEIINTLKENKLEIISTLQTIPSSLCESDIKDMVYIAEQHFLSKTPVTINDFQYLLFQVYSQNDMQNSIYSIKNLSNLLCFPLSVSELLSSCQNKSNLNYFVVDCRPPDQYNNGHLSTAFHLDCSLMLNDPSAFLTAVEALLASQKQAIEAKSIAGGEHLCFMGSGRDEDDCYVNMVVSSFLKKHNKYVSLLHGGYESLHNYVMTNHCEEFLVEHNHKMCLNCKSEKLYQVNESDSKKMKDVDQLTSVFFQKLSTVVKPKFAEMKEKIVEYVANPNQKSIVKHVSSGDKLGRRYKGSKFSLDDNALDLDEDDNETINENIDEINIEDWKKDIELLGFFECFKINPNMTKSPGYLALTKTNLFVIKESDHKKGFGTLLAKRPLEMIVQITSKRKCPEMITFKYGHGNSADNDSAFIAKDTLVLVDPFEVIRMIKQQVVTLLDQNNLSSE